MRLMLAFIKRYDLHSATLFDPARAFYDLYNEMWLRRGFSVQAVTEKPHSRVSPDGLYRKTRFQARFLVQIVPLVTPGHTRKGKVQLHPTALAAGPLRIFGPGPAFRSVFAGPLRKNGPGPAAPLLRRPI